MCAGGFGELRIFWFDDLGIFDWLDDGAGFGLELRLVLLILGLSCGYYWGLCVCVVLRVLWLL